MLKPLKNLMSLLGRPAQEDDGQAATQLRDAVASLLFLLMLSDDVVSEEEIAVVRQVLAERYGLAGEELDASLKTLQERAQDSVSTHRELETIRQQLPPEERGEVLSMCWQLAYADGRLSPDEEHLIRRIAQLLHLPHSDYIRTKLKWLESMDAQAGG